MIDSKGNQEKLISFNPLPSGSIKQAKHSIPGLDSVWQVQSSIGGKSAENKLMLRTRMSERLRHKYRALLAIDYEQLILAHYPQIYKVKCFANLVPEYNPSQRYVFPRICPGHVTIVLLPYPDIQTQYGGQLWISGHLIREVRDFITRHTSAFVFVHLVNPVYETIQVRCTVKLKKGRSAGVVLGTLNDAISAYLSPWHETVGYTTHFGWRISKHEVQSYIQQLDFVDRVTNFSMLRIAPVSESLFDLTDTAVDERVSPESCEFTPRYPWSIAVPIRQHFIEVDDSFDMIKPEITGVGELEIGANFILSDRNLSG